MHLPRPVFINPKVFNLVVKIPLRNLGKWCTICTYPKGLILIAEGLWTHEDTLTLIYMIMIILTYLAVFTIDIMELVVISPVQRHVINCVKSCDGSGHENVDTKLSDVASELIN